MHEQKIRDRLQVKTGLKVTSAYPSANWPKSITWLFMNYYDYLFNEHRQCKLIFFVSFSLFSAVVSVALYCPY